MYDRDVALRIGGEEIEMARFTVESMGSRAQGEPLECLLEAIVTDDVEFRIEDTVYELKFVTMDICGELKSAESVTDVDGRSSSANQTHKGSDDGSEEELVEGDGSPGEESETSQESFSPSSEESDGDRDHDLSPSPAEIARNPEYWE